MPLTVQCAGATPEHRRCKKKYTDGRTGFQPPDECAACDGELRTRIYERACACAYVRAQVCGALCAREVDDWLLQASALRHGLLLGCVVLVIVNDDNRRGCVCRRL